MATTNGSKSETKTTGRRSRTAAAKARGATGTNGADTNGTGTNGTDKSGRPAAASGRTGATTSAQAGRTRRKTASATATGATAAKSRRKTAAANATGATARARIDHDRPGANGSSTTSSVPPNEPAERVLDLSRLAWFRTQIAQMEQQQRERLMKVAQLTIIAIIFITFVLQNSAGVNVHFLLFSVNIRLIWVIFGCGLLGGVAGYLIGRPDKSLKALVPPKVRRSAAWGRFPRKVA